MGFVFFFGKEERKKRIRKKKKKRGVVMGAMGLAHVPPRLGHLATMALCATAKGVAGHHACMCMHVVLLVPHRLAKCPRTSVFPIYRPMGCPFFYNRKFQKNRDKFCRSLSPYFSLL